MPETAYRFESCRGHLQAINGRPSTVKADGKSAPVAQLDRALDYGSRGWGFKSSRAYSYLLAGEAAGNLRSGARSSVG